MSLHHLGIAHFPVLHQQFSSPTASASPPVQDVTQDNMDVLLERLNDLVLRISENTSSSLDDRTVTAIHSEVDRIEVLVKKGEKHQQSGHVRGKDSRDSKGPTDAGDDVFWGPLTPTRKVKMRLPGTSANPSLSSPRNAPRVPTSRAVEIAGAAEELASSLATTVAELQTRIQESDHIHDLLITRAEKAAQRIIYLEDRIAEMEDCLEANQSELRFLRIQLQAIEAQCSAYIPRDTDEELMRSIRNWKIDWEDIDRRSKARRTKNNSPLATVGYSRSPGGS